MYLLNSLAIWLKQKREIGEKTKAFSTKGLQRFVIGERALPFIHQTTTKYTCQHQKEGKNDCTCLEYILN